MVWAVTFHQRPLRVYSVRATEQKVDDKPKENRTSEENRQYFINLQLIADDQGLHVWRSWNIPDTDNRPENDHVAKRLFIQQVSGEGYEG